MACNLIFYDPDNGMEVKSRAKGNRNSSKYIYWDEVIHTFEAGHSVLVYQHFPHEKRIAFIQRMVDEYQSRLNAIKVCYLQTPLVAYFLNIQEKHLEFMDSRLNLIIEQWGDQIKVGRCE